MKNNTERYTERAQWPGLLLTAAEWREFDNRRPDEQREYYRFTTKDLDMHGAPKSASIRHSGGH